MFKNLVKRIKQTYNLLVNFCIYLIFYDITVNTYKDLIFYNFFINFLNSQLSFINFLKVGFFEKQGFFNMIYLFLKLCLFNKIKLKKDSNSYKGNHKNEKTDCRHFMENEKDCRGKH